MRHASALAVGLFLLMPSVAHAADAETNLEVPPGPEPSAPLARRGFQLAVQSGLALPMGDMTGAGGDKLSNTFGNQVPVFVDVGMKLNEHFFVGGYVGMGFGGGGPGVGCGTDYNCFALTSRFGAQVQYHVLPAAKANPWFGLGIGLETASLLASARARTDSYGQPLPKNADATLSAFGPEFARATAGLDLRISRGFGIGPVVQGAIAEYTSVNVEQGNVSTVGPLRYKGVHEWVTFGARGVIFP